MIKTEKLEQLVQRIEPQSYLKRSWPLKGGLSVDMTALELDWPDGQTKKMIVRRPREETFNHNPQVAANEFRLLQILHTVGTPTPQPYYLDPSGDIFTTPYLVIEYIEGQPEFSPPDVTDAMLKLGTQLAQIHCLTVAKSDHLSFLPQRGNACPEMRSSQATEMNYVLSEGRIRRKLASSWPSSQPNQDVLLHGDFWPGNVLWQGNKLVAVIDWEDAKRGDPLVDLAISRLDLVWIFGIEAMHTFTHQYQSIMDINYNNLPYWDLCAALRLIRLAGTNLAEWVSFFPPFGRSDITEQTLRENYDYFINQAFEKLANS